MGISESSPHFVIFPFMAQGHTIPLLNLTHLLRYRHRHVSVTIVTTPANSPSIRASLSDVDVTIIELPFPQNIQGVPLGVESTDKLPSMSCFLEFCKATKLMKPSFEQALDSLLPISCIISDGFLGWTQESAAKLGIPRLVFFGMSNFAMAVNDIVTQEKPHAKVSSEDEPFSVPNFPHLMLTKNDFEPPFGEVEPKGPYFDFIMEQFFFMSISHGLVMNSFYEIEPSFHDYLNQKAKPKAWCVGPLCLAKPPWSQNLEKPLYIQWLDSKLADGESVLYIAFGTQAELLVEQCEEIALGLEESKVNFLWVVRVQELEFLKEFEDRVKDRGMVVKEWVDQVEILKHESVKGFLSHCGWNSVMESICEGVPILAMPLMAEQHVNARMVVEEIRIGLRVMSRNGSVRGLVGSEEVEKMVRVLMEEERGEGVRKKVKEVREAAHSAMEEGGSSWKTLDQLIHELCGLRENIHSNGNERHSCNFINIL